MKTSYQCEVCRERYDSSDEAMACEAQKATTKEQHPPLGLIFGSACGPGPRCHKAVGISNECDHLCTTGFLYIVQGVGPMESSPHRTEVRLGIFRNELKRGLQHHKDGPDTVDLKGLAKGKHLLKGYANWSAGTYFPFGTAGYGEWKGHAGWESWPNAESGPTLDRALRLCRAAGFEPFVLSRGQTIRFKSI